MIPSPCARSTVLLALLVFGPWLRAPGAGLDSMGNTDGVVTWRLGPLEPGRSAREVVLVAWERDHAALAALLDTARGRLTACDTAERVEPAAPPVAAPAKVWIANDVTDFALEGPAFFRWRIERQALRCPRGGQLSQLTWYVHYYDESGEHRAGTPHDGDSTPENLRLVEAVHADGERAVRAGLETLDGALRIGVRASVGEGPFVVLEFRLENSASSALRHVRLSVYANIESAHDEGNDYSCLDRRTGGLLVHDPPTGACAVLAGLRPPATGYSGTWNSLPQLQSAAGIPFDEWTAFAGVPAGLRQRIEREQAAARGIYLPFRHENPTTPETRTLTAAEAESALERDWTFQAMDRPLGERAVEEIRWARELAERLSAGPGAPDLGAELAELSGLERGAASASADGDAAMRLYLSVRRVKRRIAFKNPVLDFSRLVFIDQPYPRGPVNDIHESIHRMGITATPGGRLLLLDGLHPGGEVRKLAPERPGSFWRPEVSYDAESVLYCFKAHDEKSFHLWEMRLDGTDAREITSSDYDDVDPIRLPDGKILFTTTRGNSHVRCGPFIYSYILARCDADGRNIYLTSMNGEPDFVPSLLDDGRVIYSRWEYSDKPLWRAQKLWTTNQDGTGTAAFWGNQSVWPDHTAEPRAIPGSRRVMFDGVGHHDWFSGSIGIIDPDAGRNFPDGLTKVTADLRWPECSIPPVDPPESPRYHPSGAYTGYKTPWPLSEKDFLVSARGGDGKFRLYLMDVDGNRELIWEGAHNVWHAMPVEPRPMPPRQPDLVKWPGTGVERKPVEPGSFFSPDVYQGVPDLPRGAVKYLRVMQLDYKTYTTWAKTYRHSGPPVSIVQEEGVKRVLSIVPVEADGSVHFEAPAGRSLFFQLLDADLRCLQTMRSFTGVLPGERRGCVGCHELHTVAPPLRGGLALGRPPTPPSPPPWGTESIGYERFAQPVIDRACGKCHQGDGEARKTLDLTLRPGHDVFKEPYLTLVGGAGWGNPVPDRGQPGYGIAGAIPVESMDPSMNDPAAYGTLRPMQYLSYRSRLIEIARSGEHHEVKADPIDLQRLMVWVDACCPYLGEEEVRAIPDPEFAGIEELPIRPRVRTAPVIERP